MPTLNPLLLLAERGQSVWLDYISRELVIGSELGRLITEDNVTGLTSNGEPNIDGIRNAARMVRVGLSRLQADAVVMNPTDSMYLDLSVDAMGRYRIGDPFGQVAGAGPRPSSHAPTPL